MANAMDTLPGQSLFPTLKSFTLFQRFLMYASAPYHILCLALKSPFFPKNDNPLLNKHPENIGIKKAAFAKEYSVDKIKAKSKENGVTFNDFVITAISMTVKQYFIRKGDERTSQILLSMPVSFRETAPNKNDFYFGNNVSVVPVVLDLVTELKFGVKRIAEILKPFRETFYATAQQHLITLCLYLPFLMGKMIFLHFSRQLTVMMTNV